MSVCHTHSIVNTVTHAMSCVQAYFIARLCTYAKPSTLWSSWGALPMTPAGGGGSIQRCFDDRNTTGSQ